MSSLAQIRHEFYVRIGQEKPNAYKFDSHFKTLLPFVGLNRFSNSLTFDINMVALATAIEGGVAKLTSVKMFEQLINFGTPAKVDLTSGYSEQFSKHWLLSEAKKISKMNPIFQKMVLESIPEFVARYRKAYPEGGAHVNDSFANLVLTFAKKQEWLSHYVINKRFDCCGKYKKTFENIGPENQKKVVALIEKSLGRELNKLEKEQPLVFKMLDPEAREIASGAS